MMCLKVSAVVMMMVLMVLRVLTSLPAPAPVIGRIFDMRSSDMEAMLLQVRVYGCDIQIKNIDDMNTSEFEQIEWC
jgi:hypothetical protein